MRRLQLFAFVAPLLLALACRDATAPRSAASEIRSPQHTLAVSSATPEVSAGGLTCALKTDGTVVCWGVGGYGQTIVPAGLSSVTQVSEGNTQTCALKTDRTVVCWGWNNSGQSTVPAEIFPIAQVSAGGVHNCALKTDGTVVCWGDNNFGQWSIPAGLASVKEVSAGFVHTCALKTDGTVVCWGYGGSGQTDVPPGLSSVTQVSAGYAHTCAVKQDGTVVCWGAVGQFGFGQEVVPVGLTSVTQVAAGGSHSCALKTNGTVICWGDDSFGQVSVPAGLNSVEQVSAGYAHTCALKTDGTVVCWGALGNMWAAGQATVPFCLNLKSLSVCHPVVGPITAPIAPIQGNTTITAGASFTESGTLTHTAVFNWGDGTSSGGTVTDGSGSGAVTGTHVYTTAGVYTITLTVTNQYGGTGQSVYEFVVVFDPGAGFVTGGGWVNSPTGAYAADPTLTGRANFGFVSRYQKGAIVPSGNSEFQFQAGNLNFKSTSYDWLVISGPQAKYKGTGSINGAGDFGFLLSAVDGVVAGGGGTDKFRIKIWNKAAGTIIYDNQIGGTEDAAAATGISGGDIVIHN
jgi:alpha-tubulin suppressor-like RCC1 family protein